MRNQLRSFIKTFILMAFCLFLIAGCSSLIIQKPGSSTGQAASECRVIQHKFGESCIPVSPQRIIALESAWILDPLLALGIKPVGTVTFHLKENTFPGLSSEEVAGITLVGTPNQPSFEKILMLKPDLILSLDAYVEQNYQLLSKIAPTVPIEFDIARLSFKENFRFIAQLVGRENKVEEVLNQYHKRIEEVQRSLGAQLKEIEVSVLESYGREFLTQGRYAAYFQILKDIGIRISPKLIDKDESVTLSIEVLNEYDADILFIIDAYDKHTLSLYLQKPLLSSLKAVKNNRVYIVKPNVWWPYGPLGMSKLLDDLEKHLINPPVAGQ